MKTPAATVSQVLPVRREDIDHRNNEILGASRTGIYLRIFSLGYNTTCKYELVSETIKPSKKIIRNWIHQNTFSTTQSPVKFQINYYKSKWILHSCPHSYWILYSICSWDSFIKLTKKQAQVLQVKISCLFRRVWSAKDYSAEADYWWQWSILWGVSMAGPHSHCRVPVWGRTG